ncbi:MAG: RNase adapter protein RapZ, partial [uncultured Solirubrobacteraceae bacterium]
DRPRRHRRGRRRSRRRGRAHRRACAGRHQLESRRPGRHLRLLRRRQVAGHAGLRGCGLLLRRQPAARDAAPARRALRPRGIQGQTSLRRLRHARGLVLPAPRRGPRGAARGRGRRPPPVPGSRAADPADPLQGDAPPPSARAVGQRRRRHSRRSRAAGADPRGRRLLRRHDRLLGRRPPAQDRRRDARARELRQAGGLVRVLRAQARPPARCRSGLRRALPHQPPLRGRAASADRLRLPGRRAHLGRRAAAALLRPGAAAARLPAARVRRRGQGAPRGGDRLHRRKTPLGGDRRGPRRALPPVRRLPRRGPAPRRQSRAGSL